MKSVNPILEPSPDLSEHPLEVPQYVLDARKEIEQEIAIQLDMKIDKPKVKAKPINKAIKKENKTSPKRCKMSSKPFKGIITGIRSNPRLKVNDTPGWNQESDKNLLTIDQIMKFSEIDLKNFIELSIFESNKEQLGNMVNTPKITLMYGLIELKKVELGLIYNYMKNHT